MDFNLIQALDSTTTVHGSPGLFYPADKAKLERLWHKLLDSVETEQDFESVKVRLELMEAALEELINKVDEDTTRLQSGIDDLKDDMLDSDAKFNAFEDSLTSFDAQAVEFANSLTTLNASLNSMADDQQDYVRDIAFDSAVGALHFFNGYGAEVFTIGGATYETVDDSDADSDSDGDQP